MFVIFRQYRHRALKDDDAMIKVFVHKMNRATAHLDAIFKRLALGIESGKRRQQRWVNVQYPIWERFEKYRRNQPHIARQAHQIDFVLAQAGNHGSIVLGASDPFALDYMRVQSTLLRSRNAGYIRLV